VNKEPTMSVGTPRNRPPRTAYLLAAMALIAVYLLVPTSARPSIRFAVTLATIPALIVGMQRTNRNRRPPWILLITALALISLANAMRLLPGEPSTNIAHILDALGNLVILLAALQLIRQQQRANLGSIIDTSIVAFAVGGLLWDLVLGPHLTTSSQTRAARLALFVIVLALSGVLGALTQMMIQRRILALRPLMAALVLGLVGDITLSVTTDTELTTTGHIMIIGAYTAVGLFALDPTAQQLADPAPPRPDKLSPARLVFLGLAVAALPVVIAVEQLAGGTRHSVLLLVSSATITTLVMLRIGLLSAQRDHAETALRYEATHDPLTDLPNRKEFTDQVGQELTRRTHSAIIFCDLDRFKAINDQYGHAEGDQVLVEVAQRLRSCVRANDVVSRLGGDEFVILIRDTNPHEVHAINQRIAKAVAHPVVISDKPATIGVTTGTAFTDNDADADELIERADHAMYLAKTNNQAPHSP
jgi:diguanylate cyclase (GGDEF)-like protein